MTKGKKLMLGAMAGGLAVLIAVAAAYVRFSAEGAGGFSLVSPFAVEEPEQCAQVMTTAVNPATGELKDFPTPCAVPAGWDAMTK